MLNNFGNYDYLCQNYKEQLYQIPGHVLFLEKQTYNDTFQAPVKPDLSGSGNPAVQHLRRSNDLFMPLSNMDHFSSSLQFTKSCRADDEIRQLEQKYHISQRKPVQSRELEASNNQNQLQVKRAAKCRSASNSSRTSLSQTLQAIEQSRQASRKLSRNCINVCCVDVENQIENLVKDQIRSIQSHGLQRPLSGRPKPMPRPLSRYQNSPSAKQCMTVSQMTLSGDNVL